MTKPNAYFISLVATSVKGIPEKENYLYDIATEMELQGFQIHFLSSNDLQEFYRRFHPGFDAKEVNVYEIAHFFIKMHHGSSFFLDEVPFISTPDEDSNIDDDTDCDDGNDRCDGEDSNSEDEISDEDDSHADGSSDDEDNSEEAKSSYEEDSDDEDENTDESDYDVEYGEQ